MEIIYDYETEAINKLIEEYESINGKLTSEIKEKLFEELFICGRTNSKLPKVEGIKVK